MHVYLFTSMHRTTHLYPTNGTFHKVLNLSSTSEHEPAINIGVSYADFGQYEICVEAFFKDTSLGLCCRKFNNINCEPSTIGGTVFFDQNNDAINNSGDSNISDLTINLYTIQGSFVATTLSNADGTFEFAGLAQGQYYIEAIDDEESLIFSIPNVGNDDQDSDITGTFGPGTSDIITVSAGEIVDNIGIGFNESAHNWRFCLGRFERRRHSTG